MSESGHDQVPDDEPTVESERSGPGNLAGTVALLLSLVAVGVAAFVLYRVMLMPASATQQALAVTARDVASLNSELSSVITRVEDLQRQVNLVGGVRERLDEITAELAAGGQVTPEDLAAVEQSFHGQLEQFRADAGVTPQDWLLAESEYLIRLGAQRVETEGDAAGALRLFRAADEILRAGEGVAAFDVRDALANDIAQLEAVVPVDIDGIFLRLGALKPQVFDLQRVEAQFEPAAEQSESAEVVSDAAMDRVGIFLSELGTRLLNLVDYRRDQNVITPALPPREEYYLRQNLILKLQLAQLAVLRGDQAIFDQSLNETVAWIESYFDPDHPVTISMLTSLQAVAASNVAMAMPDVSGSVRAVRAALDRFAGQSAR